MCKQLMMRNLRLSDEMVSIGKMPKEYSEINRKAPQVLNEAHPSHTVPEGGVSLTEKTTNRASLPLCSR